MSVPTFHNVGAARERARRLLPRAVFDYIDGGADDEVTMALNEASFRALGFRPRAAVAVPKPVVATTVLGEPLSMPVLLAPCGFARVVHPDGDAGAALAARQAGIVSVVSGAAAASVEEVARDADGARCWYQPYFLGGRAGAQQQVERARASGYRALVLTVDTPAVGNRERDVVNRIPQPLRIDPRTVARLGASMMRHPRWLARFVRDGMPVGLANAKGLIVDGVALDPRAAASMLAKEPPTWADLEWLRQCWDGPIVVKGILRGADARRAVDAGANAIVVSNHGGRQLDCLPATISVLPEVVAAVGRDVEVLMDSGVRRGADVAKAVALGARAVLIGRPYLWALACGGRAGVEHMLRNLRVELIRTMKLLGCSSIEELDPSWVVGLPAVD